MKEWTGKELIDLGFEPTRQIVNSNTDPTLPEFGPIHQNPGTDPCVYIWASCADETITGTTKFNIIYVGKAGKGIEIRCVQHANGFRNSPTGRKNAEALKKILGDNNNPRFIHVFRRKSKTHIIAGINVSLYASEEDAFCQLFTPKINRAGFPEIQFLNQLDANRGAADQLALISECITNHLAEREKDPIEIIRAVIQGYGENHLSSLYQKIRAVENCICSNDPEISLKPVGGYSNVGRGLNGVPLLAFGHIAANGDMMPEGWWARIFLKPEPVLVLNERKTRSICNGGCRHDASCVLHQNQDGVA